MLKTHVEVQRALKSQNSLEQEQERMAHTSWLENLLQSYNNQNNADLA